MKLRSMSLFEAVKSGLGGDQNAIHAHLIVEKNKKRTKLPLTSLRQLHRYRRVLEHPEVSATLVVGIGDKQKIADARRDPTEPHVDRFLHTYTHLKKEAGSRTFAPAFVRTQPSHRRLGWAGTLWDYAHKKITKAGFDIEHDWEHQTAKGSQWAHAHENKKQRSPAVSSAMLSDLVHPESEWHTMTPRQRAAFRAVSGRLLKKSGSSFDTAEVSAVRQHMKQHGAWLHPFSVVDALTHLSGGNYRGTTPIDTLRQRFLQHKALERTPMLGATPRSRRSPPTD